MRTEDRKKSAFEVLVPLEPEHISCRKVSPGRGCQTQVNFPAPALGPYLAPLLFNTETAHSLYLPTALQTGTQYAAA